MTASAAPPLIYDYSGFPPESYVLDYKPPGSPALAARVAALLAAAGLPCRLDAARGLDHGAFVLLVRLPRGRRAGRAAVAPELA